MNVKSFLFVAAVSVLVGGMTTPGWAEFNYADFSSTSDLTLVGTSAQSGNRLRLTEADTWQVGALWTSGKQSVEGGFETTFAFEMGNSGQYQADGIAFVIQNDNPSAIKRGGCNLGYGGISNSIAIEFDTYQNSSVYSYVENGVVVHHPDDPSGNHVSIQVQRTSAVQTDIANSLGYTSAIPNLRTGIHSVNIKYLDHVLSVALDNSRILSVPMTLSSFMNCDAGTAWVGFTASTGTPPGQVHDILNWSFTEVPEPATLLLLGLGGMLLRRR